MRKTMQRGILIALGALGALALGFFLFDPTGSSGGYTDITCRREGLEPRIGELTPTRQDVSEFSVGDRILVVVPRGDLDTGIVRVMFDGMNLPNTNPVDCQTDADEITLYNTTATATMRVTYIFWWT